LQGYQEFSKFIADLENKQTKTSTKESPEASFVENSLAKQP